VHLVNWLADKAKGSVADCSRRKDLAGGYRDCYGSGKDAAPGGGHTRRRGSIMTMNKIPSSVTTGATQVDQYQRAREQKNDGFAGPKDLGTTRSAPVVDDQADISENARKLADLRKAIHTGRTALVQEPDVRANKLAQVKERLAAGFYQSAEVRDQVAGSLTSMFLQNDLL
jgi:hypothetical protein